MVLYLTAYTSVYLSYIISNCNPKSHIPILKHQIIYPVKLFDYWRDRVSYEDHIVCLFRIPHSDFRIPISPAAAPVPELRFVAGRLHRAF